MTDRTTNNQGLVQNWGASNFPIVASDQDASQEESVVAEAARTRLPLEVVAPKHRDKRP